MDFQEIVYRARLKVHHIYRDHSCKKLPFHNESHVLYVTRNVEKIAIYHDLNEESHFVLKIAALFSYVGYLKTNSGNPLELSIEDAKRFLQNNMVPNFLIEMVITTISDLKHPRRPSDLCGMILCDADSLHLGSNEFLQLNETMYQEAALVKNASINWFMWLNISLRFLVEHRYFTDYALTKYHIQKAANIDQLKQMISKINPKTIHAI